MEGIVVIDSRQSLLQNSRVEKWVKSVFGDRKSVYLARHDSSVLFRGQVLYLGQGKQV